MGHESRLKLVGAAPTDDTGISAQLLDRFGRPILVGGVYTFAAPLPIPLTVKAIAPMLDPTAPPNAYRVTLVGEIQLMMFSRSPNDALQYVGGLARQTPQAPPVGEGVPPPDAPAAGVPTAATPTGITLTD